MSDKPTIPSTTGTYEALHSAKVNVSDSIANSVMKNDKVQEQLDKHEIEKVILPKDGVTALEEQRTENIRVGGLLTNRVEIMIRQIVYSILVDTGLVERE
tara:strand:- start:4412 stop:4711 length:300 start_codon:yes stop_codon:yes gene_type:complete